MTPALRQEYSRWLPAIYLDNPMRTERLGSLVAEDSGEIVAFLGVVPRQVTLGGKVYLASVSSNFCARADRRGALGVQVAREYLSRSHDLVFIDELQDRPRRLWDHLGFVAMPQSVRWTLPLAPLRHIVSIVSERAPKLALTGLFATPFDRLAARVPRSPFRYVDPGLTAEGLNAPGLARLLAEFGPPDTLRPVTTDGSVEWLVARARAMTQYGDLQMLALRDGTGQIVGWYVYYASRGRPGDVLQLVATPVAASQVLDHLARDAIARGVVSLTGTLDPVFLSALSSHWAVLTPGPASTRWMMVHSEHRDVLEAFWRGRLLLSRLDGEWCHHFR